VLQNPVSQVARLLCGDDEIAKMCEWNVEKHTKGKKGEVQDVLVTHIRVPMEKKDDVEAKAGMGGRFLDRLASETAGKKAGRELEGDGRG
jgi:hypothetical protein